MDGAHQFWRWQRRTRTHLCDGGRPHRDPPTRWRPAGSVWRDTPHRSLLLCWSSTTTQLRRDLDAQGASNPPSFLPCVRGTTMARGRTMCVVDQEVENRLALLVHITFPLLSLGHLEREKEDGGRGDGQLHRHHPRHHPAAARRLPQVRLRDRVLNLLAAHLLRLPPWHHLRRLGHH
uniref:Uncharacterized protein n=1 Tax=Triticum urartu TaxID=4572 RepID=A0A8R7V9Z7_TRIUA